MTAMISITGATIAIGEKTIPFLRVMFPAM